MKQNERLLVYAVTGFLALILVIAVVFGSEPANGANKKPSGGAPGLGEILGKVGESIDPAAGNTAGPAGGALQRNAAGNLSGLLTPNQVTPEQPLVARPQIAADLVAKELGASQRDRFVRIVRAQPGDSLGKLVERWCGSVGTYLDEAIGLNEDLHTLRAGQQVLVPWIDDEEVLALIEARKPRMLAAEVDPNPAGAGTRASFGTNVPIAAGPGAIDFDLPGAKRVPAAPGSGEVYTVKGGDSLWKIAATKYGNRNAPRMIDEIKRINPGLSETLQIGQKITLPVAQS